MQAPRLSGQTDLLPIQRELEAELAPGIQSLRLLGRGGMGAVFVGRDPALKREVVIKVLAPDRANDAVARARFAREAEAAASISHPNVVSVFRVGELPNSGTSYFVMQYVDGPTLAQACPIGTKVPQARCRRIVGEIASALAAAHARDLIHRDIKPSNIMLEGGTERVVVLDFGISAAAVPGTMPSERLTGQGISLGTPEYMSPEQASGDTVTDRTDVYSLGVVAFELLAGRELFKSASVVAVIAAHIKDAAPAIGALRPDLDADFARLIDRMLTKDPAHRPAAAEVARACSVAAQVIEWPPPGLEPMRGAGVAAVRWLTAMVIGLGVLLFVVGASTPGNLAWLLAGFVVALLSVGLVCAAGIAFGVAANHLRWARGSGYPVRVAVDVLLDPYPDTVYLLNGMGRFAAIAPTMAQRWLTNRRRAAAIAGVGSALALCLGALWAFGKLHSQGEFSEGLVGAADVAAILAPACLGWLVAFVIEYRERAARLASAPRRRIRDLRRPHVPQELVSGWLLSVGVSPPADSPELARRRLLSVEWLASAAMLLGVMTVFTGFLTGMFLDFRNLPPLTPQQRRSWVQSTDAGMRRVARADSVVRQHLVRGVAATADQIRALRSARRTIPPDRSLIGRAFATLPSPVTDSLREALTRFAADSALPQFRSVARSASLPTAWYLEPRAALRDNPSKSAAALRSLTILADENIAAALLALSSGAGEMAVARVRETLAMGWLLMGDPVPVSYMYGVGIVQTGAHALAEIGRVRGLPELELEARSIKEAIVAHEVVRSLVTESSASRVGASPADTTLVGLAGDRRLLPSERWIVVRAIARGACWNGAEIHGGVSPKRRAALERAATRLADVDRSDEWTRTARLTLENINDPATFEEGRIGILGRFTPAGRSLVCSYIG
ncbi:MAG: serine/threonine-protein kinase [Gemmatimonadota bacterium]